MSNIRFIAETAFSHEGSFSYLESLVSKIIKSRADVVKLQVLLESEYMPDHPMADKCQNLMLSKKDWLNIFEQIKSAGKKVLVLPVDFCALQWVVSENLADILEVHSVNLFRRDFFEYLKMARPEFEIMLSVSGYELESIDYIVSQYKRIQIPKLSLMFGFQSFPTKPEKLGLGRIALLRDRYGLEVGYADHTAWSCNSASLLAASVSLGAVAIEKHIVLEEGAERIDYNSAVDSSTLDELINEIKMVISATGDVEAYFLEDTERSYGDRRLKLVTTDSVSAGDKLMPPKASYRWTTRKAIGHVNGLFERFGEPAPEALPKSSIII